MRKNAYIILKLIENKKAICCRFGSHKENEFAWIIFIEEKSRTEELLFCELQKLYCYNYNLIFENKL